MTRNGFLSKLVVFLLTCHAGMAFVTNPVVGRTSQLQAASTINHEEFVDKLSKFAMTAAVAITTSPLMALAEADGDYEYGAVDAPIGIAVAGGLLAILTAAVPLAMQGGEEAFEEMKERDSNKWGRGGN